MFKNHPKGLLVLALTNMGERFGYYTMLAILTLYMQAKFGLSSSATSLIYGTFLGLVYFLPLVGGFVADKALGYGKTILLGVFVMFAGYLLLAAPSQADASGKVMMYGALALIALGTGFFKGNLQVLVGNLYESNLYKARRDVAFSIFYMFINIGAFFAPGVANSINNAFLAKDKFTYDASIAKSYVALNDRVVDEAEFTAGVFTGVSGALTAEDSASVVKKAKRKEGVIFPSDKQEYIFRLKAAGLHQLTMSGKLEGNDSLQVSLEDYALLNSRRPDDAAKGAAVRERIERTTVDPAIFSSGENSQDFATAFGAYYVSNALSKSYSLAFAVACISLLISVLIFLLFKKTWKPVDKTHRQQLTEAARTGKKDEQLLILSPAEIRERIIALFLVFFVVIFFWMSFHQNGLCMTYFARDYTQSRISPVLNMAFSLLAIIPFIVFVYGIYLSTIGLFGGKRNAKAGIALILLGIAGLCADYFIDVRSVVDSLGSMVTITPQIFQQFNPLFIILLTPLSVGLFTYLAGKSKEPSAPRKIGYGMFLAAIGFVILLVASIGLPAPADVNGVSDTLVSPGWLIGTYLVLTLAELFLSPMGISFVSKVAPPQYKGMMQGGWFASTAIGNLLVGVLGAFWDKLPLVAFWGVLIICCLLSALFIFSIMKRLEKATN
ncbi:MAG: oligopeptide:H+ symporter [Prevotellaceae bacterium]|jgi:POT family proton-dependent oligopeptide transporter|nr:oligopeptide:H+ symporter [Prevotellaceae bacterium]